MAKVITVKSSKRRTRTTPYDATAYLETPEDVAAYLDAWLEEPAQAQRIGEAGLLARAPCRRRPIGSHVGRRPAGHGPVASNAPGHPIPAPYACGRSSWRQR
jgi:hypothetical protein